MAFFLLPAVMHSAEFTIGTATRSILATGSDSLRRGASDTTLTFSDREQQLLNNSDKPLTYLR